MKVIQVSERPLEMTVNVFGTLAAQEEATLSVKVPGRVEEVPVDLGTRVRKGDLIVQVERRDYELKLQQAQSLLAQARARVGLPLEGTDDDRVEPERTGTVKQAHALLEEARKNRDRITRLFADGVIPQSELETAEAAFEVALSRYHDAIEEVRNRQALLAQRRVEYEIARQQLADSAVYAPFDGIVQERLAHAGEYLTTGAAVATLVQVDPLRLRLEVPEREAGRVQAGQTVRLSVGEDPHPYSGKLTRLSPMLDRQNRMLMVEADIPQAGSLRPGLFARAEIVTRTNDLALAVPLDAVTAFAGVEKVFVLEAGKAVERPVTTGRRGTDWVEIVTGLRRGEEVVREPGNLRTGEPVRRAADS